MIKGSMEHKLRAGEVLDMDLVLDFIVDEFIKEIHGPLPRGITMIGVMARCEAKQQSKTSSGKRTIRKGYFDAFCESPDHIVDVEANTVQYIK
jgi:hypothetical protein